MKADSTHHSSRRQPGAALRLEGLTRRYEQAAVVDNLDLAIAPGEFVTLLGASGSGKTTTLMMVAGFTEPSQGRVLINDRDITHLPPAKRDLGVVFQHYTLFPHLSVADNLAFPLEMRGVARGDIKQKVADALALIQLEDKGHRLPRELSGGQQQRVALARALIFSPAALLMDEPLGALDKKLREHMQLEIKRLHAASGSTVVFVTHDQEEALTLSDHIAVMQQGRIAQIDTPHDLYTKPKNRWVAEFIGQSNFIDGQISAIQQPGYDVRLSSGETVCGQGVAHLRVGESVLAVLRPEHIRIGLPGEASAHLPITATIAEMLYLGHTLKLTLVLSDGARLLAQLQNSALEGTLRPGATVRIGWATESLWFIPSEAKR
ncbi:ABC transporter ATP-binding protein [Candidatus Symbiopectobacterium sp. NZEC151]|uniref:ABC transporter ATP-binding protein n=1 Tax=Candidatus Symbiopectobacterium sp. NZEC151 TaxID=2820470 RepID=UPI002225C8B3|nr:ABC transporter ATP-binding protein [Candidatus Symbiopectobacterium sp. NZEC151]